MSGVALDIGGTKIAVSRVSDDGALLGEVRSVPTPARSGARAVLRAAANLVGEVQSRGDRFLGVSSAGVVDPKTGAIAAATDTIPGWAGTDLRGRLADLTGLDTSVINDGHAFALGEHAWGEARSAQSMLVVAVGTGVGGAFVADGRVLIGATGRAGHLGHLPVPEAQGIGCTCGASGHAEAVGGGAGILAAYRRRRAEQPSGSADGSKIDSVGELVRRASRDDLAREVIDLGGRAVGTLIGGLANALDPEVVVVGGGVAQSGDTWWAALTSAARVAQMAAAPELTLTRSRASGEMALLGAARHALEGARP